MTIEYENTLDDLVAFNLYHLQHSPTARRQLNFMRYGGAMVLAVVLIMTDSLLDSFSWSTGLGIVLIVGWILFLPALSRRVTKKSVGRLLVEGRNQVMLGKRTLKLQPDSVVEITDSGEISTKWHAVDKIVKQGDFIFIYFGAVTAFVVPRRAFETEEAFDGCYETANKLRAQFAG